MTYIAVFIFAVVILLYYINYRYTVLATDGRKYNVLESYENQDMAANMLSRINRGTVELMRYLKKKYGRSNDRVNRLLKRYNPDVLYEHRPTLLDPNIAYTMFKGRSLHICIRDIKTGKFQKYNTIMFVMLHELAHIATHVRQHPPEFWLTFRWLIENAVEASVYHPVNYALHPEKFCDGTLISYNPLYDNQLKI